MKPRPIAVSGYARVSSVGQNLDRQMGALRAERCDKVFAEKASGKSASGRPQLEKALDQLGTGDVLVVAEWDRATRSMIDGVNIIERINARGALIKVLDKPHLDLTAA
jgi:DNA invertase Pin-like site-specific DNA recombinase